MSPTAVAALGWLGFVAGATAWAALRARPAAALRARPAAARPAPSGAVWLVRPCAGDEPGLAARLASSPSSTPGALARVVLAVASERDGAWGAATAACGSLGRAGLVARVAVTGARGPNAKADQLARALEGSDADVIVVVDSDVALAHGDLEALLAPLGDPEVAATWAAPIEIAPATRADRSSAAVLGASLHAFALLSALDPGCFVGKAFAIRARALAAVGGFGALRDHLGEDVELARRLRARGMRVARAPIAARSEARGRSWADVVARYARWIWVIRAQRPALVLTYPLLFMPTAPLLVLGALTARASPLLGAALLVGTAALRLATAALAQARAGARPVERRSLGALARDAILADALMWSAWARALARRTVTWRGAELTVARGGSLSARGRDA